MLGNTQLNRAPLLPAADRPLCRLFAKIYQRASSAVVACSTRSMDRGGVRFRNVRSIRVGGFTKPDLLRRLAAQSVSLNDYARALFADAAFTTSSDARDVQVAVVSLTEIGLPSGGLFDEILARAATLGLQPCPLEVAPHLRLSYLNQPEGPYLTVASTKLRPGPETPNGFYLRRLADGLWLRGYESGPENIYAADFTDFAFQFAEQ